MQQFNDIYIPIAIIVVGTLLAVQLLKAFVDSLENKKSDWYYEDQRYDPYNKNSDDFGFVHKKTKETSGQKRDSRGRFLKTK